MDAEERQWRRSVVCPKSSMPPHLTIPRRHPRRILIHMVAAYRLHIAAGIAHGWPPRYSGGEPTPRLRKMPSFSFGGMPAGMPPEECPPRGGGNTEAGRGFDAGNGTAAVAPPYATSEGAVAVAGGAAGAAAAAVTVAAGAEHAPRGSNEEQAGLERGGVITSRDEGRDAELLLQAAKMAALKQLQRSWFEVVPTLGDYSTPSARRRLRARLRTR